MDHVGRPTTIDEFARLIGNYRRLLIQNGVPSDRADLLVHDYHTRYLEGTSKAPCVLPDAAVLTVPDESTDPVGHTRAKNLIRQLVQREMHGYAQKIGDSFQSADVEHVLERQE